jgi:hypothetical protein
MIMLITLRPDHFDAGKLSSTNEDPLALSIKEKLGDLYKSPRDMVAVGDDEVYLAIGGKHYTASYDILALYRTSSPGKSRQVKLDFKPFQLSGN